MISRRLFIVSTSERTNEDNVHSLTRYTTHSSLSDFVPLKTTFENYSIHYIFF
jgi:hypothetical protein